MPHATEMGVETNEPPTIWQMVVAAEVTLQVRPTGSSDPDSVTDV